MGLTEWAALLGNFGEFVGAFAVVATLAYLAVQVGHSKKALDAHTKSLDESRRATADTNRIARASGVCEWLLAVATNDDLRRSFDAISGFALAHEATANEFDVNQDDASRTHYAIVYYFWLHWGTVRVVDR